MVLFTAAKRHAPQHMCPQGVSVAFVGAPKQMGQVYADSGSPAGAAPLAFGFGCGRGEGGRGLAGESEISSTLGPAAGLARAAEVARALPFPLPFPFPLLV